MSKPFVEPELEEVNPLKLINPLSPYADLFVNIYNVTQPSSEWMKNYVPHMFDEDTNKCGSNLRPRSLSPVNYYDEDFERGAYKRCDVNAKLEEERRHGDIYRSPVQCGNKWAEGNRLLTIEEQLDMDQSPVRVEWLRGLMYFMADRGSPLRYCPTLPGSDHNRPLDLFKFYNLVQLYGSGRGSDNCAEKAWNDISELMGVSREKTHILKNVYGLYLLSYELHLASGISNKVGDNSQDLEDANYNLPSPVRSNVHGNWKRKKKNRLGKKSRQSVFKRLGKKNIY